MKSLIVMLSSVVAIWAVAVDADAQGLGPLSFGDAGVVPSSPWYVVGLPRQSKPFTTFAVVDLDGQRALRIEANLSYGNLVYPLRILQPAFQLSWKWRVEELIEADNLREKQGDDTAVKVCVLFDLPLDRIPFVDRQLLRMARSQSIDPVPGATVCYVWDAHLPIGTALDSPFTRRLRYKVLQSGPARLHQWTSERRNVAADFVELFGRESAEVPPVIGVVVGADSDNTRSHSLAHVADVVIVP